MHWKKTGRGDNYQRQNDEKEVLIKQVFLKKKLYNKITLIKWIPMVLKGFACVTITFNHSPRLIIIL